jgi:RND family efflux transporter MFP subunit
LEAEANLKIAQASLNETVSQFELAEQEFRRVRALNEKGIASPSELDAAASNYTAQESRLKLAKAQVEQREASLKSAQIRLNYTVLMAAAPGFIGERFVDEGSLLAPNSPVMSVIGIDTVIIKTTIIERVYGRIEVGQTAEIEVDAYPTKRFYGKVTQIAPMLQEISRVAKTEVKVANDSLFLKPGMFAKLQVVLAEKKSAQTVPAEALVSRGGENGIFMVEANSKLARYVPVKLGIIAKDKIEILSPKIEGLVITLGQHLLEDGSALILPGSEKNVPQKANETTRGSQP